MKIEIQSKKGLRTVLSVVIVIKNYTTKKWTKDLSELQKRSSTLKVLDLEKFLHQLSKNNLVSLSMERLSTKFLEKHQLKLLTKKKLKIAGQPKIDLKQFAEGKDLNYELQIDCYRKLS